MLTNAELHTELTALATTLANDAERSADLADTLASLAGMRHDREKLMMVWVTMHFDHVAIHGSNVLPC